MSAETSLRLSLSAQTVPRPAERFDVTARFTNVSAQPVRLLLQFDPLPVFFTTRLEPPAGGEVDVIGAGKADYPDDLQQKELAPGESVDVALDLSPWIRGAVTPGSYRLALTYHNAYGTGCVRGPLTSAPIVVEVTGVV